MHWLLLVSAVLILSFQNCGQNFESVTTGRNDSFFSSEAPEEFPGLPRFEGPAPKILDARVVGDNPFPVFVDESGKLLSRDRSVSYRFRTLMPDFRFKKLGTFFEAGDPKVICAITVDSAVKCQGSFHGVDLTAIPAAPEPIDNLVGSSNGIFGLSVSQHLYWLQLTGGLRWVQIFPTTEFKKISANAPRDYAGNESPTEYPLRALTTSGSVFSVKQPAKPPSEILPEELTLENFAAPSGIIDIASHETDFALLYSGMIRYCRTVKSEGAATSVSCDEVVVGEQPQTLWSQNSRGKAACLLSSEQKPFCFAHTPQGTVYLNKQGQWQTTFTYLYDLPVKQIDYSVRNSHLIVLRDENDRAILIAQKSTRLGADLFARIGFSRTDFEAFALGLKPFDIERNLGIINNQVCGTDVSGSLHCMYTPYNGHIIGLPNTSRTTVQIGAVPLTIPFPRSERFIVTPNNEIHALVFLDRPQLMRVLDAPATGDSITAIRCYGNTCQVDYRTSFSRLFSFIENQDLTSWNGVYYPGEIPGITGYRSYEFNSSSRVGAPFTSSTGGLTPEQRKGLNGPLCGIRNGAPECLFSYDYIQNSPVVAATTPAVSAVDIRSYFGRACAITSEMRLECLHPIVGNGSVRWEFRPVAMREPAVRFFESPVYQGASGRFYALRLISNGTIGDFELRRMPQANLVKNLVRANRALTPWQALSADGDQGVIIEYSDGTSQYRGIDANDDLTDPLFVDVRYFR